MVGGAAFVCQAARTKTIDQREDTMKNAKRSLLVSAMILSLSGAAFAQGAGGGGGAEPALAAARRAAMALARAAPA